MELVAAVIVPESVASDIRLRGISFTPDERHNTLLRAWADDQVLAALKSARTIAPVKPEPASERALLQHLSQAGNLIYAKRDEEAAAELDVSLSNGVGKSELGFVMGHILIDQQQVAQAAQVYSEIFNLDPDFPEVHTRLSYLHFAIGDTDGTLREAKAG